MKPYMKVDPKYLVGLKYFLGKISFEFIDLTKNFLNLDLFFISVFLFHLFSELC